MRITEQEIDLYLWSAVIGGDHGKRAVVELLERAGVADARVMEHHRMVDNGKSQWCDDCGDDWPCPTVRVLSERGET